MNEEIAVTAENVSKKFRIYHERNQSIKQMVLRRRRGVYEEFWALKDVSLEIPTATSLRPDRRERLRQVDPAQVHGEDPGPR